MGKRPDFINQYILTKAPFEKPSDWKQFILGEYTLYTHPVVETTYAQQGNAELIVLGYCYDYRNPEYTNQQVIDALTLQTTVEKFLDEIQYLSGLYLLIWKTSENFLVIPDLGSFREVFIDHNKPGEIIAAASPNLIHLIQPLQESAENFYKSKKFLNRKVWVHNKTNYVGITRLKPNHLLDVSRGTVSRFFPIIKLKKQSLEAVVEQTHRIMPGIIKAAYIRNKKIMIGLTAGWDSRFLLAASREIHRDVTYFVNINSRSKTDCVIASQLADKFDLQLYQLRMNKSNAEPDQNFLSILPLVTEEAYQVLKSTARDFSGYKTISGSASEIARSEYSRIKNLTGAKLAALSKYPDEAYCIKEYDEWLQYENSFKEFGYHPLDFFYWEEGLGNRVAKSISEAHTLGVFISPAFNCRYLMSTFLSADEKYREKQNSILHAKIIEKEWKEILAIPVNPGFKKKTIWVMQKLGIYNFYRNIFTTGIWR